MLFAKCLLCTLVSVLLANRHDQKAAGVRGQANQSCNGRTTGHLSGHGEASPGRVCRSPLEAREKAFLHIY